jgi:hypothetical protein
MDGSNCGLVHEDMTFRVRDNLGGTPSTFAVVANSRSCFISLKGWNMTAQGNALGNNLFTISPVRGVTKQVHHGSYVVAKESLWTNNLIKTA